LTALIGFKKVGKLSYYIYQLYFHSSEYTKWSAWGTKHELKPQLTALHVFSWFKIINKCQFIKIIKTIPEDGNQSFNHNYPQCPRVSATLPS
jgi:hypothetical protein